MISVIGGGPAGSWAAYNLAKEGKEVSLFEEHANIGSPVQCTGLLTPGIDKKVKIKKEIVMNEITDVRIISGDQTLDLKLKQKNLVLNRGQFDSSLADMAVDAGAKIFLNYSYRDSKPGKIHVKYKFKKDIILPSDHIIGADGPMSQVAKANGIFGERKFMAGAQALVKLDSDNAIEFWPDIGEFAWSVPEGDNLYRVGVASYTDNKKNFDQVLKLKGIEKKDIISTQGGLIPIYNPKLTTEKKGVFLIGDAATHVKATTGGGIIQGMDAAEAATQAIINSDSYTARWRKVLGKDLWLHLMMRNVMDKFKVKDWKYLVKLFQRSQVKNIIETFDRDYPTKFIVRLGLIEPRLAYFARFLF